MTIRESILFYQKQSKLSNLTLCKECEINVSSYSLFLKGKRGLPYENIQKIFTYLNLSVSKIIDQQLK